MFPAELGVGEVSGEGVYISPRKGVGLAGGTTRRSVVLFGFNWE
jgi:hypothetical protein